MAMRATGSGYPNQRWFEDFKRGDEFCFGVWEMIREEMLAFARLYDPEPFHVDEAAAKRLGWRALIASGPQIGAIYRRLSFDALPNSESVISPGWDGIRWLQPVYAGDLLSIRMTVTDTRPLASHPGEGVIKMQNKIERDIDDVVAIVDTSWFIRLRSGADTNSR